MNTTLNWQARLEELAGRDRVCAAEEELQRFAIAGQLPVAVLEPQNQAEVAQIVRFAASEKLAIVCCGSRSKLEMGMPPERYNLAFDLTGLQEIVHYDPADLTLSVDAGMPLKDLEKVLAAENQFLPLGVPYHESTTIGGAVASGIDSTLRQQYGTARDFLIGAEFVDGKGQLCKSGGRVVKNVTGYDLHKLLIGSLGTLAAITRLNFRTFPLPELRRGHLAGFATLDSALAFRAAALGSGLPISNLELFDADFSIRLEQQLNGANPSGRQHLPAHGWHVYTAFEGNEAVVRRVQRELSEHAGAAKALSSEIFDGPFEQSLRDALRESFAWVQRLKPGVALLRVVLPSVRTSGIAELQKRPANCPGWIFLLRACGVAYLALYDESEDDSAKEAISNAVRELLSLVDRGGGSATLVHAPLWLKQKASVWGVSRPDFALMQRVKRAFDPQNVFAPGRFVGGI